jgi:hypothetical protein
MGLAGNVFLEMWCHFPGQGESFSRGLHQKLSGNTPWTTLQTAFFLKSGEKPDLLKLNLVVEGTGTISVRDVRLATQPL